MGIMETTTVAIFTDSASACIEESPPMPEVDVALESISLKIFCISSFSCDLMYKSPVPFAHSHP